MKRCRQKHFPYRHPQARHAITHGQYRFIFADELGLVFGCEVDELLVIPVFADIQRFASNGHQLRMRIKLRQDVLSSELAKRQALDDVGVGQHTL